ncbi:hypothetical protein [Lederbergia citrea]|uniref:hypothetical protein n=1 Tax=Lederbergia citrea TaxID=2833581 RepID=UPI003211B89E
MSLWLTLHLIGVVLFVGNIITAALCKMRADLTKNSVEIHSAVKNILCRLYIYDPGSCPHHRLWQFNGCTRGNANVGV